MPPIGTQILSKSDLVYILNHPSKISHLDYNAFMEYWGYSIVKVTLS